jgi:hypothetical protein
MHYNTINLILGNESQNNNSDNEVIKIQKHLRFVKQKLLQANILHLNEKQKSNRFKVINILQEYIDKGLFPQHDNTYPNSNLKRLPRFIDHNNTHCAVGYLILKTIGEKLPEKINKEYEYSFVKDIKSQELLDWANEYGLSVRECEMIQPSYGTRMIVLNADNIFTVFQNLLFFFLPLLFTYFILFKTKISKYIQKNNNRRIYFFLTLFWMALSPRIFRTSWSDSIPYLDVFGEINAEYIKFHNENIFFPAEHYYFFTCTILAILSIILFISFLNFIKRKKENKVESESHFLFDTPAGFKLTLFSVICFLLLNYFLKFSNYFVTFFVYSKNILFNNPSVISISLIIISLFSIVFFIFLRLRKSNKNYN